MNHTVVIHTGGLGDFLQILPILEALRRRAPQGRITIIGRRERADLAVLGGLADETVEFETSGLHRLFAADAALPALPAALRSAELIVNFLPHEIFSGQLARLTAARVVNAVSFPPPGADDCPAAQFAYDQVATQLGWPPVEAIPRLRLTARQRAEAHGDAIALHPGSGSPRKNWPLARFRELAALLAARGSPVAWLLGPAELEQPQFAALCASAAGGAAKCLAAPPLADVAALLATARGYVGNDSGVTHLAAALGRPTVALFGPSPAAVWGPRGPHVRVIIAESGDLAQLSSGAVLRALDAVL